MRYLTCAVVLLAVVLLAGCARAPPAQESPSPELLHTYLLTASGSGPWRAALQDPQGLVLVMQGERPFSVTIPLLGIGESSADGTPVRLDLTSVPRGTYQLYCEGCDPERSRLTLVLENDPPMRYGQ